MSSIENLSGSYTSTNLGECLTKSFLINNFGKIPDRPIKSVILPPRTTLITELPSHTKEPFSTIISEEHVAKISVWIDRFTLQTFCHGHSNTVVVVKVARTDEIIGSYNPLT
ncbi:hypothetical protein Glove_110g124 [Diversispora epigaea]|uniref:TLDc domain-containing protein n=1 Tax=Diversispora epigaea TaxID=1348612 RepID=A0A397J1R6_9GLOM|nr:hypothetical protein Glove_110g124 [Diversispora epigaea]